MTTAGRLFAVRGQMCAFDDYFSIQINQGVVVTLFEPVLLESDLYLLMGAEPTSRVESVEGVVASYVFTQLQQTSNDLSISADEAIEIKFLFLPTDDGLKLSRIKSSEIPAEFLENALPLVAQSAEYAQRACDVSINPFSTSAKMDIDRDLLDFLPSRQELLTWLGPPLEPQGTAGGLSYEFQLKGDQAELPIARFDVGYDQVGDRPMAIAASFTRYRASIDVPTGTMQVKFFE